MDALDFPDTSVHTSKRNVSFSAFQSLSLLNNPFTVTMSENLAKRLLKKKSVKEQAVNLYELVFLRHPSKAELGYVTDQIKKIGLTAVCKVFINSSEFFFVE